MILLRNPTRRALARTRLPAFVLLLAAAMAAGAQTTTLSEEAQGQAGDIVFDEQTGQFIQPPPPERGWQAFADVLQKASPSANTAIPLSPSQVTDHIAALLDQGQAARALEVIQQRQQQRDQADSLGTDVQLAYLRGRALAQLGRHPEAIQVWHQMTIDFPELPEPWNALAIQYVRQGRLDQAREALLTALTIVPNFAPALQNLGHVDTQLAQRAFAQARQARGQQPPASPAIPQDTTPANPAQ